MLQLNFHPFPILETERLILRAPLLSDAEEIFFHRTDKEINKYIFREKTDTTVDDTRKILEHIIQQIEANNTIFWVIMLKGEVKPAGTVCLWNISKELHRGEAGYTLHSDFWGRGIMNEALAAVLHYGFELMKLHIIEAYTHRDNVASRKVLERNGFTRNAALEDARVGVHEPETTVIYTLKR